MSEEILTPVEIERRILEIDDRLVELTHDHEEAVEALAIAESAYRRAYNLAHLASTTDFPKRKVEEHRVAAEIDAADEFEALLHAKGRESTVRQAGHSYRQVLHAMMSLNANVRYQAGLQSYRGAR